MTEGRSYFPALDGLRAVAALSVLLGHFGSKTIAAIVSYGDGGVIVFFVLSGFLITNILLGEREHPQFQITSALKGFYLRRALRIFPLYYLAILICAGLGEPHVRMKLASLMTFNLPGLPPEISEYGTLAHFWSLFVEEQFYLLWPLFIFCMPKGWLGGALLIVPLFSLGLKHLAAAAGMEYRWIFSSVYCCADHLGAGALLAYGMRYCSWWQLVRRYWVFCLVPVVILSLVRVSHDIDGWFSGHLWFGVLMHSAWTFAGIGLVTALVEPSRMVAWFAWSPLRFVGRISYGIYVYHYMVPFLQDRLSLGHMDTGCGELAYKGVLTLILAALSWYVLESPFLSLKKRWGRRASMAAKPAFNL